MLRSGGLLGCDLGIHALAHFAGVLAPSPPAMAAPDKMIRDSAVSTVFFMVISFHCDLAAAGLFGSGDRA
ncbi:hypothetical protein [Chromobacterium haemolyticum]|uniref:hypothetical protein n=1 Tax=Chromobacterium haemolyticum TaxID=394935 RepID=UPI0013B3F36B|nr:hypothetical protein [Chromobacterium haemolyticum]